MQYLHTSNNAITMSIRTLVLKKTWKYRAHYLLVEHVPLCLKFSIYFITANFKNHIQRIRQNHLLIGIFIYYQFVKSSLTDRCSKQTSALTAMQKNKR